MGEGLQRAVAAAKRTHYPGTPAPAIGQRWADCDKRHGAREVVIRSFTQKLFEKWVRASGTAPSHYVTIERESAVCDVYIAGKRASDRGTTINVDRLIPVATGFRYVGEGPPMNKASHV